MCCYVNKICSMIRLICMGDGKKSFLIFDKFCLEFFISRVIEISFGSGRICCI